MKHQRIHSGRLTTDNGSRSAPAWFRYGVIGHADGSLVLGAVALIGVNLALLVGNYLSFQYGSRLRP